MPFQGHLEQPSEPDSSSILRSRSPSPNPDDEQKDHSSTSQTMSSTSVDEENYARFKQICFEVEQQYVEMEIKEHFGRFVTFVKSTEDKMKFDPSTKVDLGVFRRNFQHLYFDSDVFIFAKKIFASWVWEKLTYSQILRRNEFLLVLIAGLHSIVRDFRDKWKSLISQIQHNVAHNFAPNIPSYLAETIGGEEILKCVIIYIF